MTAENPVVLPHIGPYALDDLPNGSLTEDVVTLEVHPHPPSSAPRLAAVTPVAVQALMGMTLMRIVVDDALTLALRAVGREAVVRIDGTGSLCDSKQQRHPFDPDESTQSLGCVLRLLQLRVDAADVETDGSLVLRMAGNVLTAFPHPHQVSWSVSSSDDSSASCLAEGMVVWR